MYTDTTQRISHFQLNHPIFFGSCCIPNNSNHSAKNWYQILKRYILVYYGYPFAVYSSNGVNKRQNFEYLWLLKFYFSICFHFILFFNDRIFSLSKLFKNQQKRTTSRQEIPCYSAYSIHSEKLFFFFYFILYKVYPISFSIYVFVCLMKFKVRTLEF